MGTLLPLPQKGAQQPHAFWPMSIVDEGRPRPRPHCVTWGSSSPKTQGSSSPRSGTPTPNFRPMYRLLWPRSPISATADLLLL